MLIQASLKVLPKSYTNREQDYKLVDEALVLIKESGLKHEIGCSETTIEGKNENVLALVQKIQEHYYEKNIEFTLFLTIESNKEKFYIENKKDNISKI